MTEKTPRNKPQATTSSRKIVALIASGIVSLVPVRHGLAGQAHTFAFWGKDNSEFLLDGKPFQIRGRVY